MEKKEKFSIGDLCLYYDNIVILLRKDVNSINTNKYKMFTQTSYVCLFSVGVHHAPESALRKI